MPGGDWLPFSSGCFDVVMSKSKCRGEDARSFWPADGRILRVRATEFVPAKN